MITKTKSDSVKILEKMIGQPLSLGLVLRSYRQGEEMTQAEMAKKLGISGVHLSQIEKGQKFLSPERAQQFAKKLGHSEKLFIGLSLQDQLTRAGLKYKITLENAA